MELPLQIFFEKSGAVPVERVLYFLLRIVGGSGSLSSASGGLLSTSILVPIVGGIVNDSLVAVGTDKDSSLAVGTNEDSPVAVGTNEDSPVAVGTDEDSSLAVGTNEDSPVAVGTNEDSPVAVGTNEDSPVGVGSNKDSPVAVGTDKDCPVIVGTDEDSPLAVGTNEDSPLAVGTDKDCPVVVGTDEDSSLAVGTDEDSPFAVRLDKVFPSADVDPLGSGNFSCFPGRTDLQELARVVQESARCARFVVTRFCKVYILQEILLYCKIPVKSCKIAYSCAKFTYEEKSVQENVTSCKIFCPQSLWN